MDAEPTNKTGKLHIIAQCQPRIDMDKLKTWAY